MLIARRSRHYAGTRYLKRGISVHGKVANDCETEQVVQVDTGLSAQFCSHVQMRGSIPVYWSQETSVTMPKPPININRVDPNYTATQDHFADLLVRYKAPIIVLDLVKQQEKHRRETLVGAEYRQAVSYVNLYLPLSQQVRYCALDYDLLKKKARAPKGDKHVNNNASNAAELAQLSLLMTSGNNTGGGLSTGDSSSARAYNASDMNENSDTLSNTRHRSGSAIALPGGGVGGGGGYSQKAIARIVGNNNNVPIYNINAIQASFEIPVTMIPQVLCTKDLENILDCYLNTSLAAYSDISGTYPGVGTGLTCVGTGFNTGISYNTGSFGKKGTGRRSGSFGDTYASGMYYSGNIYESLQSTEELFIGGTGTGTAGGSSSSMNGVPLSPAPSTGIDAYTGTPGLGLVSINGNNVSANSAASMSRMWGAAAAAAGGGGGPAAEPKGPKDALQERINEVTDMSICETGIFTTDTTYLAGISELRPNQVQEANQRGYMLQTGVMRTNCIDCIDRTNAAQIYMGLKGLHISMQALGLHAPPGSSAAKMANTKGGDSGGFNGPTSLPHSANAQNEHSNSNNGGSNSNFGAGSNNNSGSSAQDTGNVIVRALIEMYTDMGNKISMQYGGSEAHLKFAGIDSGKSAIGENFTSVKRYYNNSFLDIAKQHAMNVFLGMYVPVEGGTPLQESEGGDHHLHNKSLRPGEPYTKIFLLHDMRKSVHALMSTSMIIRNFDSRLAATLLAERTKKLEEDLDFSSTTLDTPSKTSTSSAVKKRKEFHLGDNTNDGDRDKEKLPVRRKGSRSTKYAMISSDKSVNAKLREICGVTGEWAFQATPEGTICMLPLKENPMSATGSGSVLSDEASTTSGAAIGSFQQKHSTGLADVSHLRKTMSIDIMQTLKRFNIDPRKACNTNKNVGKYAGVFSEQIVKKTNVDNPAHVNAAYGLDSGTVGAGSGTAGGTGSGGGSRASFSGNTTVSSSRTFASKSYSRNSFYNRASGTKGGKLRLECFAIRITSKRKSPDPSEYKDSAVNSAATMGTTVSSAGGSRASFSSGGTPGATPTMYDEENEIITIESADSSLIDPWTGALIEEGVGGNTRDSGRTPSPVPGQARRTSTTPTTPGAAAYYGGGGTAGFSAATNTNTTNLGGTANTGGIILSAYALQNIIRSQKRRFVNQNMAQRTKNALTMWWRGAIYEHGARTASLNVEKMSTRSRKQQRYLNARKHLYRDVARSSSTCSSSTSASAISATPGALTIDTDPGRTSSSSTKSAGPVTGIVPGVMNAHGVGVVDGSNGFSVKQIVSPGRGDVGLSIDESSSPNSPTTSTASGTLVSPLSSPRARIRTASNVASVSNSATLQALEDRVYTHLHKPSKFTFFDELLPNPNSIDVKGSKTLVEMAPYLVPEDATLRRAVIVTQGLNPDTWINDQEEIDEGLRSAAGLRVRRKMLTEASGKETGEFGRIRSRSMNSKYVTAAATAGTVQGSSSGRETPATAPMSGTGVSDSTSTASIAATGLGPETGAGPHTAPIDPLSYTSANVKQQLFFSPIRNGDACPTNTVACGVEGDANDVDNEIIENMTNQIATDEELAAIEKHKEYMTNNSHRSSMNAFVGVVSPLAGSCNESPTSGTSSSVTSPTTAAVAIHPRRDTIPRGSVSDFHYLKNANSVTAGAVNLNKDRSDSISNTTSVQSDLSGSTSASVGTAGTAGMPGKGSPIALMQVGGAGGIGIASGNEMVAMANTHHSVTGLDIRGFVKGIGQKASTVISNIGKGVGLTNNESPESCHHNQLQQEQDVDHVWQLEKELFNSLKSDVGLRTLRGGGWMSPWASTNSPQMAEYNGSAFAHMSSYGDEAELLGIKKVKELLPVVSMHIENSKTKPTVAAAGNVPTPADMAPAQVKPTEPARTVLQNKGLPLERLMVCPPLPKSIDMNLGPMQSKKSIASYIQYTKLYEHPELLGGHSKANGALWDMSSSHSKAYTVGVPGSTEVTDYVHAHGNDTASTVKNNFSATNNADSVSQTEFATYLHDVNLGLDDVSGMETLADDYQIFTTLHRGIYSGMNRGENAIDAEYALQAAYVRTEQDLLTVGHLENMAELASLRSKIYGLGNSPAYNKKRSINSYAETSPSLGDELSHSPNGDVAGKGESSTGCEANVAALRQNYYNSPSQSSSAPAQLYHKLVHMPDSVLSNIGVSVNACGGGGGDDMNADNYNRATYSSRSSDFKNFAKIRNSENAIGGDSVYVYPNDIFWNETLVIAAIQADFLVSNRRMFHSKELNHVVYPSSYEDNVSHSDSDAAPASTSTDVVNTKDITSSGNTHSAGTRGCAVLLAYAPTWRTSSSTHVIHDAFDTDTDTTGISQEPSQALPSLRDSPTALPPPPPMDPSGTPLSEFYSTQTALLSPTPSKFITTSATTETLTDPTVMTDFDRIAQQRQAAEAAAAGGSLRTTLANSLKKKEVDVYQDSYDAKNQILTVNNNNLGIAVPPMSPTSRGGLMTRGSNSNIRISGSSLVTNVSPISPVAISKIPVTSFSGIGKGEAVSIREADAVDIQSGNGKVVTLKTYIDSSNKISSNDTGEDKLLKDTTLPLVLQRLNRMSKRAKLASGLQVEINAQAKRFVNQYGSYYRYTSYDRISSRLSFLMNDSCLDTYTQCFMFNTHLPVTERDPSAITTTNPTTGAITTIATTPGLAQSQPHLHPNWFVSSCFDEMSFIAVNPSPYDMQAGRARWSGLSFLSTATIVAPFLCAARQLKFYLLLRQQQLEKQLLSTSDDSIGCENNTASSGGVAESIYSKKATRAVTLKIDFDKHSSPAGNTSAATAAAELRQAGAPTASDSASTSTGTKTSPRRRASKTKQLRTASDSEGDDEEETSSSEDEDDEDTDDEAELADMSASMAFFVEGDQMYSISDSASAAMVGVGSAGTSNIRGSANNSPDAVKSIHMQTTTTTTTTTTITNKSGCKNSNTVRSTTINTDMLSWDNRQYPGFIHLSGDMYCKDGETNVLLNEIAVRSLIRCAAQNKHRYA